MSKDISKELVEQVREALAQRTPLEIRGTASKHFYGRTPWGRVLDMRGHSGIVNYEPTELVLTARAGTRLEELDRALREQGQMLPFEPPCFGGDGTLGGAIAAGLSGPQRPWVGSVRDLMLGIRLINGKAEHLRFGGEVMKNVAGYDISRLMAGAMGTLGVITEVSIKVLPRPDTETTIILPIDPDSAFPAVEKWYREGLPVTGSAHDGERLFLRLAGTRSAVDAGVARAGGKQLEDGEAWWRDLRDQQHAFFHDDTLPLWRISLPPMISETGISGPRWHDWNGQLHWQRTETPSTRIRAAVAELGGHATQFRYGDRESEVFHPPAEPLMRLHQRVKQAFDPADIFNPGRLYTHL